jgi:hypothetical protein
LRSAWPTAWDSATVSKRPAVRGRSGSVVAAAAAAVAPSPNDACVAGALPVLDTALESWVRCTSCMEPRELPAEPSPPMNNKEAIHELSVVLSCEMLPKTIGCLPLLPALSLEWGRRMDPASAGMCSRRESGRPALDVVATRRRSVAPPNCSATSTQRGDASSSGGTHTFCVWSPVAMWSASSRLGDAAAVAEALNRGSILQPTNSSTSGSGSACSVTQRHVAACARTCVKCRSCNRNRNRNHKHSHEESETVPCSG